MKFDRLFKVLVLGGAIIGCESETAPQPEPDAAVADATIDAGAMDANAPDAAEGPIECFCPSTECCDGPVMREGTECCWGGSC